MPPDLTPTPAAGDLARSAPARAPRAARASCLSFELCEWLRDFAACALGGFLPWRSRRSALPLRAFN